MDCNSHNPKVVGSNPASATWQGIRNVVFATADLEREKAGLQDEMNVVAELIQQCVNENARVALDQAQYQSRYNAAGNGQHGDYGETGTAGNDGAISCGAEKAGRPGYGV